MTVKLNDKNVNISSGTTLQECLEMNAIPNKGIATALNGVVVPANMRSNTVLNEGDNIIIIKAFYGG